jgi:hypothetical protein
MIISGVCVSCLLCVHVHILHLCLLHLWGALEFVFLGSLNVMPGIDFDSELYSRQAMFGHD